MGNILVVDDERSIRITVKAFLEEDGHVVETAEEADAAMAVLRKTPIDVVLTDIILPRVSGVDLLRQIRETDSRIPVIMMTGEPALETAAASLRHGAFDYLQKPVGKNDILKAVRNALHVKLLGDEKLRLEEQNREYVNKLEQLVEARTRALAESEAALRIRAEELAVLNRLAQKVNQSMTVEGSIHCGLFEITRVMAPDFAALFLCSGGSLVLKGFMPEQAEPVHSAQALGAFLSGLAVKQDRAVYSSDIGTDPRCAGKECEDAQYCSFAALPLRVDSGILGVLWLASAQRRDFHERAPFLEALANEMCIGVNKSLLYEREQQNALELKASLSRIEESEAERLLLLQHLQRSQRLEAIGTLASGIAHDFNNILAVMIGCTELALMRIPKPTKISENLEMVMSAGQRAKDLIKQILAFSKQSDEERKPMQISHAVKDVLKFVRASLPATIEIREDIEPESGNILGDPVQIHQILMNLCTNAHHAMSGKGGTLEVKLASVDLKHCDVAVPELKPGPYIRLSVRDTGCGMDETTKAKIFDPYFTTKEKGVGTGLGLAVVHGLVQNQGGAITVESEPWKGSRFSLYFPVIQKEVIAESESPGDLPTGREHILLVDDEHVLLDMCKGMLEFLGYTVEARTNSMDALELFQGRPDRFDLVITDMTMPHMTGDKLAQRLIRIREDIPVILVTGYSELIFEKQDKNIRACIMKPVLMSKMAHVIRNVLDSKNERSR
ncbi:MAG: response regulator [Desulfobacteraceae bacterium]|nr:response regulator [Desulfobacteraceae bacterium]